MPSKTNTLNTNLLIAIDESRHCYERWFGAAVSASGQTHRADRVGAGVVSFQVDAGNSTWGSWVQILGSSDTPFLSDRKRYDINRVTFTTIEKNAAHFFQIAYGETGALGLAAGDYSELVYDPLTANVSEEPAYITSRIMDVGTKAWARCLSYGQNTGTMNFYFALHEHIV